MQVKIMFQRGYHLGINFSPPKLRILLLRPLVEKKSDEGEHNIRDPDGDHGLGKETVAGTCRGKGGGNMHKQNVNAAQYQAQGNVKPHATADLTGGDGNPD